MNFEQAVEAKAFTIIGEGWINFPEFFQGFARNNYSGWMVVEQDVKFGATTRPPVESIAASLGYSTRSSANWTQADQVQGSITTFIESGAIDFSMAASTPRSESDG